MTTFTSDWFSYAIPNFKAISEHMGPATRILEIGVYQGRATCWMLEHMLAKDGHMICVDPFIEEDGVDAFTTELVTQSPHYNAERLALWRSNTEEIRQPEQGLEVRVGRSYQELAKLIQENQSFDFIYVDGNHSASSVLADACMCFGMLRPTGIMLFDDYLWGDMPGLLHRPKLGIDYFTTLFSEQNALALLGYQLGLYKI
jgi:predicted O-methyltransferase YrrM